MYLSFVMSSSGDTKARRTGSKDDRLLENMFLAVDISREETRGFVIFSPFTCIGLVRWMALVV